MSMKLSVVVTPGPLKVSGADSVHFCGEPLEAEGDIYLCRCGGTGNAPFCDGSHKQNGFDGSRAERGTKPLKVWQGTRIETTFNPNTCMHVFYCKPLAELRKREEAGDEPASDEIARVVESCPSGALTYRWKDPQALPSPAQPRPDVDIQEGGEIRIQRKFDLNEALNEAQPDDRATLCRCGLSKNKPFCDGRHAGKKGFR